MKTRSLALAATLALTLGAAPTAASAMIETPEAQLEAAQAAHDARDMFADTFDSDELKPGKYRWKDGIESVDRIVVSLNEQLVYAFKDGDLVAVSTISSGRDSHPTPTGIFPIMEKKRFHRSNQYDDAPMPYMQRLDTYGIAFHAGELPGYPASHGCIRLPTNFAAKLFGATEVGTPVLVGRYEVTTVMKEFYEPGGPKTKS